MRESNVLRGGGLVFMNLEVETEKLTSVCLYPVPICVKEKRKYVYSNQLHCLPAVFRVKARGINPNEHNKKFEFTIPMRHVGTYTFKCKAQIQVDAVSK